MVEALTFPKPGKKIKKARRKLDSEYVFWVHSWPCSIPSCGRFPVDAHHVVTRSRLGSDRTCIPLCHFHHLGWVHSKGVKTTEKEFGIRFDILVLEYNKRYEKGEKGPHYDSIEFFRSSRIFSAT
jgi:hypothetical protein